MSTTSTRNAPTPSAVTAGHPHRDPQQATRLVPTLSGLGVQLPAALVSAADQLSNLNRRLKPLAGDVTIPDVTGYSDDQLVEVIREIGVSYALLGPGGPCPLDRAEHAVMTALEARLADSLAELGDEIIDQLRPAFDEAAAAVHRGTKLGIHPGTTDRDVVKSDNLVELTDAWTALPGLVRTLDAIAEARIQLSEATGLAPALEHSWSRVVSHRDAAGAMFREDAPTWDVDFEHTWHRWVRLCASGTVRLLSVEETAAAWKQRSGGPVSVANDPESI